MASQVLCALRHHAGFERIWLFGGYVNRINGNFKPNRRYAIPEEARIIAIADAYDAMSSQRNYSGVMKQKHVRAEIEKGKGTQFDPHIADVMLRMIDEDEKYKMNSELPVYMIKEYFGAIDE